jgi:ketosteroid isomerase-like protein
VNASKNLDLVRSILAAWERGDFSSADWAHPEIEYVIVDGPSPGRSIGRSRMAEGFRDVVSVWQGYRLAADEYRELDDSRVLVLLRISGRGKTSGLDLGLIRTGSANLFHLAAGKVTRLVIYFDRDRAFADLGLDPEGGSQR